MAQSKKSMQYRTVCFTVYNWGESPQQFLEELSKKCTWCIGQVEQGEEPFKNNYNYADENCGFHLQGMAYNSSAISWSILENHHREKCISPADSLLYCQKEEGRLEGPWEFGKRPTWNIKGQRRLNNSEILTQELTTLWDEEKLSWFDFEKARKAKALYSYDKKKMWIPRWNTKRCLWMQGEPGCGKSSWAHTNLKKNFYIKSQNKWWDGYYGQTNVLIDDFDKAGDKLSHFLKIWTDWYEAQGEIKCGHVQLEYTLLCITSNYYPEDIFDGELLLKALYRRMTVVHCEENFEMRKLEDGSEERKYDEPNQFPHELVLSEKDHWKIGKEDKLKHK